jgi:3-oxoadipate enol-lactonase/4-carboxymuconolactone decarboxylase
LPFVNSQGARIFYRLEGQPGKPVLVFSHSIGTDQGMWSPQVADLLPHFQILRYDTRGHGASDSPPGEYSVEMLGQDVLALVNSLAIDKFALCGLSMGGAVGQWLAVNANDRLSALVLANSSPQFTPRSNWETRIKTVREGGMAAVVDVVMGRFFSAEKRATAYAESIKSVFLGTNPTGYLGCCVALRDHDFRNQLKKIQTPTLIISGDLDVSTPWEGHSEILASGIRNAQIVRLPAAHLSNLERPRSFSAALMGFLLSGAGHDMSEEGTAVRCAVLGDAHVDRSIENANEFTRDFQELITRFAWGTVWTRPELDHRTRRLLVLATMAALGRWEEFAMHVRAGFEHELEPCDLKEVLLQTAIYAGVPAANTGFQLANKILEEIDAQSRK